MKIGVDLSMWNSPSNFTKAKANGLDFAILRAGSGRTVKDPSFERNYNGCVSAGLPKGAYWYLYARDVKGASLEAQKFLNAVAGKTFEYPLYLDLEDPSQSRLSRVTLTEIAIEFLLRVESSGYYVGLYSMGSWFRDKFLLNHRYKGKTLNDFDFWVAHWTHNKNSSSRYVNSNTGMWQYTNKGNFEGIGMAGRELDMNVCFRDYPKIIGNKSLNKTNSMAKSKEIVLVSKLKSVDVSKSIEYLRDVTKNNFYLVETMSGYFDYSKFKNYKIIALGGEKSNHSSYVNEFYGGNDMEVLKKLKSKY